LRSGTLQIEHADAFCKTNTSNKYKIFLLSIRIKKLKPIFEELDGAILVTLISSIWPVAALVK